MKKIFLLSALTAILLSLASCGDSKDMENISTTRNESTASETKTTVGETTTSSLMDEITSIADDISEAFTDNNVTEVQ